MDCPLCALPPEHVIWEDDRCRVIRVDDPAHPGFCRVVWGEHSARWRSARNREMASGSGSVSISALAFASRALARVVASGRPR